MPSAKNAKIIRLENLALNVIVETSLRQLVLTLMDLVSNADKCSPASDLTLERATYAIPALKTLSDRSTMVQSSDSGILAQSTIVQISIHMILLLNTLGSYN